MMPTPSDGGDAGATDDHPTQVADGIDGAGDGDVGSAGHARADDSEPIDSGSADDSGLGTTGSDGSSEATDRGPDVDGNDGSPNHGSDPDIESLRDHTGRTGTAKTHDDPADPRELLVDLVSIPSPSGDEDPVADRLVSYFAAHGRDAWIDDVGNVRAPGNDAVLLTSHMDTVPGDIPVEIAPAVPSDDTGIRRVEGHESTAARPALWGRGSVDATGSLAAMAVTAVRTGVSFAGVVREETDSRGARHLVTDREQPGAVINGEPSGWSAFTLGYRGFLAGTYWTSTDAVHTSRPAANAIQVAMDWWQRVATAIDAGDPDGSVFESVTAKPVAIEGGVTDDGLAVEAEVQFQVRVPPGRDPADLREDVEKTIGNGSPIGRETIDWDHQATVPPFLASPRNPVAGAFRAAIRAAGGEPAMKRKTGTADANLFADAWDCPVVTYGPGDSTLDHAPNEHLPLAEFDDALAVLETVAERLMGQ